MKSLRHLVPRVTESPRVGFGAGAALVAALAVLLYGWTIGFDFAFDDGAEVVENGLVHSWAGWSRLLTTTAWAGIDLQTPMYRPLTSLSFLVNHSISALEPWSYHAVNVALHALVTSLVAALGFGWGLSRGAALVGAALFAVHPIHVEVVANVAGRKDLLVTLFLLLLLLAHARSRDDPWPWAPVAGAALAAALLSKELALIAIGLVAVQDLASGATIGERRRLAGLYCAYLAVFAAYLAVRWRIVGGLWAVEVPFVDNPVAMASLGVRTSTALGVVARGLALLLLPWRLSPDYSFAVIPPAAGWWSSATIGFVALAAPVAVILVTLRYDRRAWLLTAAYGLTLLPVSNLVEPIGSIFGERFLYAPSIFFCLAAGAGLVALGHRLPGRSRPLMLLLVFLVLGTRTVSYAGHWHDDESLFRYARRVVPASVKVYVKWGDICQRHGHAEEAVSAYRSALRLLPGNPVASLKLALLLDELDREEEANPHWEIVLAHPPRNARILYQAGVSRRRRGRLDEAAGWWQRALDLRPDDALALGDLGSYYLIRGQPRVALELLLRAAAAGPRLATTQYNLALAYDQLERSDLAAQARERYRELSRPKPDSAATDGRDRR